MRSMTGFGQGRAEGDRLRVAVTLRAVNHRYLDVQMRLKDELRGQEKALRDQLGTELYRGRVEAVYEVESLEAGAVTLDLDRALLGSLRQAVDAAAADGFIGRDIQLADVMRLPDALRVRSTDLEFEDEDLHPLQEATASALAQLVAAREAEGQALRGALDERIQGLRALHVVMSERAGQLPAQLAASLRERIGQLLEEGELPDETRLAHEVALTVDRHDISEELDRLGSHLEHFESIAVNSGSIGKRLDFLSQEIFRELNTIGSKCRDAPLVRHVLDGKVLCEQIREQVQNVE